MEHGEVRGRLEALALRAGLEPPAILVAEDVDRGWPPLGAWIGGLGKGKIAVFGESLLAKLSPDEAEDVFAHELGHLRRRHARAILLLALAFFLFWLVLESILSPLPARFGIPLRIFAVLGSWFPLWIWISRRFELEADLEAADLVGADRYGEALRRGAEVARLGAPSFLHPPLGRRLEIVRDCSGEGPRRAAFLAGSRRLRIALRAAPAIAAAACLASLALRL